MRQFECDCLLCLVGSDPVTGHLKLHEAGSGGEVAHCKMVQLEFAWV